MGELGVILPAQDHSKVRHGYRFPVHWVDGFFAVRVSYCVQDKLMPEEIEIYPVLGTSSSGTAERLFIKLCRSG